MGANNTARTLGGCVSVAMCSAILCGDLTSSLGSFLSPNQVAVVLSSTTGSNRDLTAVEQAKIQEAYGKSYNKQFLTLTAFGGTSFVASIVLSVVRHKHSTGQVSGEYGV